MASEPTDLTDQLSEAMGDTPVTPNAILPIQFRGNRWSSLTGGNLSLANHQTIGYFAIDGDRNYVKNGKPPTLRLPNDLTELNVDLKNGFAESTLISNYNEYYHVKRESFFKWIMDEFNGIDVETGCQWKPGIVCFGGLIRDTMMTHYQKQSKWTIFGIKFNESVFLFNEMKDEEGPDNRLLSKPSPSYYGHRFPHILTNDNPDAVPLNEFAKAFVIQRIDFGDHKLMCLNKADSIKENEDMVELKTYAKPTWDHASMNFRRIKFWSQCAIPGIKTIALGNRSEDGILQRIDLVETKDLLPKNFHIHMYYEFENYLLKWIRSHLVDDDANVVKSFAYSPRRAAIRCSIVEDPKLKETLLPQWFVDGVKRF